MFEINRMYSHDHVKELLHEVGEVLTHTVYSEERNFLSPPLDMTELRQIFHDARSSLRLGKVGEAFKHIVAGSVDTHHPRFLSQQLAAPAPLGAIADMVVSALNQGHAVFDMSPVNSLIEEDVLDWARRKLLLSDEVFGVVTSGGSLSNLSALLAARNYLDGWSGWRNGLSKSRVVIVASRGGHYSISKAAGILGIGTHNLLQVDVDECGRIELDSFREVMRCVAAEEMLPIVCLTVATTGTGSVDPLAACVQITRESAPRAWIHVDAAHGGFLAMADRFHGEFEALSGCDSITWDAHKMLFQSIPLSFLFFQDREKADFMSQHDSPYLTQRHDGEFLDKARWSLECSRRSNAVKLWCTLNYYGENYFTTAFKEILDRTADIYKYLKSRPCYLVLGEPDSNIIAFRYVTKCSEEERVNQLILKKMRDDGSFLIGFTKINDKLYLRLTVMNPRTRPGDIPALFAAIEAAALTYKPK